MKIENLEGANVYYVKKLRDLGIETEEQLVEKTCDEDSLRDLAAQTGIPPRQILDWIDQAALHNLRGFGIRTLSDARAAFGHTFVQRSLDSISKADPGNVQLIAASQIQLLVGYYNLVLDQARRSFRWAIIAAAVGLVFFVAAVSFLLISLLQAVAVISLISGTLVEVVSGINFYLYGKTSTQLADFQTKLDMTQRFLLANSVCEGLDGEFKQRSRAELIRVIAGFNPVVKIKPEDGAA